MDILEPRFSGYVLQMELLPDGFLATMLLDLLDYMMEDGMNGKLGHIGQLGD